MSGFPILQLQYVTCHRRCCLPPSEPPLQPASDCMSIWGYLFFLGLEGVGEYQSRGEDIGAKEEGKMGSMCMVDDARASVLINRSY